MSASTLPHAGGVKDTGDGRLRSALRRKAAGHSGQRQMRVAQSMPPTTSPTARVLSRTRRVRPWARTAVIIGRQPTGLRPSCVPALWYRVGGRPRTRGSSSGWIAPDRPQMVPGMRRAPADRASVVACNRGPCRRPARLTIPPSPSPTYAETVLRITDGLPKQKDIRPELGGSGELLNE